MIICVAFCYLTWVWGLVFILDFGWFIRSWYFVIFLVPGGFWVSSLILIWIVGCFVVLVCIGGCRWFAVGVDLVLTRV